MLMKIVGKPIGKNKCYIFYPLPDGSPSHPSTVFSRPATMFLPQKSWFSVKCGKVAALCNRPKKTGSLLSSQK